MVHSHTAGMSDGRLRRIATFASIAVASILIISKFVAFVATDSVALLSSLFDSSFDLVASLITAYGVARALRPPDMEHRFGHGKAEPLAALVQAVFIVGSSLFLGYEAISRLISPHKIENDSVGFVVMGLAIVLTLGLIVFQKKVIAETGSTAISADRLHYVGDVSVNLAVIVSMVLRHVTGIDGFDPIFGIMITLWLIYAAHGILKTAMSALMDAELPQARREEIRQIVLRQPGALGVHDMRTRSDGERLFVELHLEMDGALTLCEAHNLAEIITAAIKAEFPRADVLIHQEPADCVEPRLDAELEKGSGK